MQDNTELYKINNRTINQAFRSAAVIAIFCVTTAYFRERLFHTGMPIYTYPLFLFFLLITIFRNKISRRIKLLFVLITIIYVLTTSILTHGLLSSLKVFIVGIPLVVSFVTSYKKALISMVTCVTIYIFFAILYYKGHLYYKFDIEEYASNIFPWLYDISILFLASWVILIIGNNYSKSLIEKNNKIQDQNKELADKEEKYRRLFDDASDAIILIKANGKIYDCNQTTCLLFKYSKEAIINKSIFQLSTEYQNNETPSDKKGKQLFSHVLQGKTLKTEWTYINSEEKEFIASIAVNKIELSNKKYIQAIIRDITESKKKDRELEMYKDHLEQLVFDRTKKLKEAQAQLFQAEKMASLGTLTAGIAHEINNPLNYIKGAHYGLVQHFSEYKSSDQETTDILLKSIDSGIERASEIVNGLRQFCRNNDSLNEECNIHTIIDNSIIILHNQLKDHISIKKQYVDTPFIIKGNSGRLHQVIINILSNANYAIDNSGEIIISTFCENDNYKIVISDNGSGIEEKVIKQVFDPFFTTKPPGEGTGIGLYITFSIIQEHKGTIHIDSTPNKGTNVIISFPRQ